MPEEPQAHYIYTPAPPPIIQVASNYIFEMRESVGEFGVMSDKENATNNAAHYCLLRYFMGEETYGDETLAKWDESDERALEQAEKEESQVNDNNKGESE